MIQHLDEMQLLGALALFGIANALILPTALWLRNLLVTLLTLLHVALVDYFLVPLTTGRGILVKMRDYAAAHPEWIPALVALILFLVIVYFVLLAKDDDEALDTWFTGVTAPMAILFGIEIPIVYVILGDRFDPYTLGIVYFALFAITYYFWIHNKLFTELPFIFKNSRDCSCSYTYY
jgi:hypothetical protein